MKTLSIVLVVSAVTIFTRALPFLLFRKKSRLPETVQYLGRILPPAIMAVLIVYCLKGVSLFSAPFGLPEFLSVALVALLHVWKRNNLLSIGAGTVFYMLLVQAPFL